MQVQQIFLKASEEYEENGFFDLSDEEFDFLNNRINTLNQLNCMTSLEEMETKGIIAIFLYSNKEEYFSTLKLNMKLESLFKKVYDEFV